MSVTLGPRESVTISDFVGERAGESGSFGTLMLTTDSEDVERGIRALRTEVDIANPQAPRPSSLGCVDDHGDGTD